MAADEGGVAIEASTGETGQGLESKQPHRLEKKWTFWFDNQSKPKQGAAWGSSLKKAYTFETVEEFWCLYDQIFRPSKLPANADFHCFKAGIEPKWEDPECANGGKWSVTSSRKANLDTMWLETLMALVGEQFDESDEICGVVASVRQRQDKLSLWTKTAPNEAAQEPLHLTSKDRPHPFLTQSVLLHRIGKHGTGKLLQLMSIGRKWKEIIDVTDKLTYSFHDDSRRDKSIRGRYTV